MTKSSAAKATAHRIGTCVACGTRYYAAKGQSFGFCSCREAEGVAQTFIAPQVIKAVTTDHECDAACRYAKRTLCQCECGGDFHGSALPTAG